MNYDRDQFDDSLLDDNFEQETEPVDEGFQRMADLEEDVVNDTDNDVQNEQETSDNQLEENEESNFEDLDVVGHFLKERGVRDGKTLLYEDDETGETTEIDFSSLSKEEQLQILNDLSKPDLSDDEISTINYLRENNTSLQDVITYFQEKAVQEYIASTTKEAEHTVDSIADDVLYVVDLKKRYPDMSDEELESELELAQSNEELFKKKVDVIRAVYKAEEENAKAAALEQQKQEMEKYQQDFVNHLNNFSHVLMDHTDPKSDKIMVEDKDKQAIYDYFFRKDTDGASQFTRDLNDNEVLIQLAWLRLYGQDAITDTTRYWKNELKNQRKATPKPEKPVAKTVVVPRKHNNDEKPSLGSAWDKYL